eukprot:TRINITY_DN40792_c0_g1_i1.p1 TRINITY_DN40792_c0_g1~~TRINITY_DN40792_c0_g1_i1.p1  ORF type:complete len:378 (+),score=62.89 TRINITY_DN40792_c0_g1_i1:137-1270(+)
MASILLRPRIDPLITNRHFSPPKSLFSKEPWRFRKRLWFGFPTDLSHLRRPAVRQASPSDSQQKLNIETDSSGNREDETNLGMASHIWRAGAAALGFVETAYLTYTKLTDTDVYCPVGGESCGDVLNSPYANVLGVPLSSIGMISYGIVSLICLELSRTNTFFGFGKDKVRWVLLGLTSAMVSASGYFMYLLIARLEGAYCAYCIMSALLSLTLLLFSLQDFQDRELQKVAGIQISTAIAVVVALSTTYDISAAASPRLEDAELPPIEPEITTHSSPLAISLAKHLHSVGAKLYGAFWCSHCYEQKQMFGAEASDILDYVECYPDGYKKGIKVAKVCEEAHIQGFPTWIIKGQVLSGEQVFAELARVSGFDLETRQE